MSGVCLETFASTVVPELEGVVEGRSQDVFAVGWEFNKRYGRVVVVYKCFKTLSGGCVPNSTKTKTMVLIPVNKKLSCKYIIITYVKANMVIGIGYSFNLSQLPCKLNSKRKLLLKQLGDCVRKTHRYCKRKKKSVTSLAGKNYNYYSLLITITLPFSHHLLNQFCRMDLGFNFYK